MVRSLIILFYSIVKWCKRCKVPRFYCLFLAKACCANKQESFNIGGNWIIGSWLAVEKNPSDCWPVLSVWKINGTDWNVVCLQYCIYAGHFLFFFFCSGSPWSSAAWSFRCSLLFQLIRTSPLTVCLFWYEHSSSFDTLSSSTLNQY